LNVIESVVCDIQGQSHCRLRIAVAINSGITDWLINCTFCCMVLWYCYC